MSAYLVVDSGTTNTRARLWEGGEVTWEASEMVGSRDTARDGHPGRLRAGLGRLVAAGRARAGYVQAVLCSGMISSNVGLHEVPHLTAPVSPAALAGGIVRVHFPDLTDLPVYIIPGVKTLPPEPGLDGLAHADVMRGEEVEVTGLRKAMGLAGAATFLHCGSHHKAIDTTSDGSITASRTALTGELLHVVSEHTILKSSIDAPAGLEPDARTWALGLRHAEEHGFGRALFLVRVAEQLLGRSRREAASYLLGALAGLDLPLLPPPASGATLVLYGNENFTRSLAAHLERDHLVHVADAAASARAAVVGAVHLFELRAQGGARA